MPDDLAEVLNEIIARLQKVEENQAAMAGAVQAFITVLAAYSPPDEDS